MKRVSHYKNSICFSARKDSSVRIEGCTNEELKAVEINAKYYTKIYDDIDACVSKYLKGQEYKAWSYLYRFAKYDPNHEAQISLKELAAYLNLSTRQTGRIIDKAIQKGFLVKILVYDPNCKFNRGVNKNRVCIPKGMAKEYLAKQKKVSKTNLKIQTPTKKLNNTKQKPDKADIELAKDADRADKNVVCINIKNNINTKNNNSSLLPDKFHITDFEKTANEFKKISKVEEETRAVIEKAEVELNELTQLASRVTENLKQAQQSCNKAEEIKQFDKLTKIFSAKALLKMKLDSNRKALVIAGAKSKIIEKIVEDPYFVANLGGPRKLSVDAAIKTYNHIVQLGFARDIVGFICSDIFWAVRFGQMVINNKTGKQNEITYALNACLKMVREGRWVLSNSFKEFLAMHSNPTTILQRAIYAN
jgi:DNA-binding Lrp family transcriptional regulator